MTFRNLKKNVNFNFQYVVSCKWDLMIRTNIWAILKTFGQVIRLASKFRKINYIPYSLHDDIECFKEIDITLAGKTANIQEHQVFLFRITSTERYQIELNWNNRNSCLQLFYRKSVLKNSKITGKN